MKHFKRIGLPLVISVTAMMALAGCGSVSAADPNKIDSKLLTAVGDAHITTDASSTSDPQGLRDRNFGELDFIAVSYANKVQREEQLVVVGLTQFDLAPIKDLPVQSAILQMYALRADLAQPARLVDVSAVDGDWNETEITFNNKPNWSGNPIATTALYGGGVWYSWDVTPTLNNRGENNSVSYVLGLRTVEEKKGEQVLFASHNAGNRVAPRLVVTYAVPQTVVPIANIPVAVAIALVVAVAGAFGIPRLLRRRRAVPAPARRSEEPTPVGV